MGADVREWLPLVYDELRALAARYIRKERRGLDLQAQAIVHEAFLRLCEHPAVSWRDRCHLIGVAARIMRQILVDRAREASAAKRGGGRPLECLSEAETACVVRAPLLAALDDALAELAVIDPRKRAIVELHFFAGFSFEEIAEKLGVSRPTVFREWSRTRLWLYTALGGRGEAPQPSEI